MRNHLGTGFMVWKRGQSWFWLLPNQNGNGGTIGTAASEDEAVSEACSSIEQMAVQHRLSETTPALRNAAALAQARIWSYPCSPLAWMEWWMSVAHQLSGKLLSR